MSAIFGLIFSKVSGVVSPYLNYVFIAFVIAIAAIAGVFWFQKHAAEKKVADLTIANDRMESQIKGLNVALAYKDLAIHAIETTSQVLGEKQGIETEVKTEITNAPPSEDGPVAPVLDRALDGIDRMLKHAAPAH